MDEVSFNIHIERHLWNSYGYNLVPVEFLRNITVDDLSESLKNRIDFAIIRQHINEDGKLDEANNLAIECVNKTRREVLREDPDIQPCAELDYAEALYLAGESGKEDFHKRYAFNQDALSDVDRMDGKLFAQNLESMEDKVLMIRASFFRALLEYNMGRTIVYHYAYIFNGEVHEEERKQMSSALTYLIKAKRYCGYTDEFIDKLISPEYKSLGDDMHRAVDYIRGDIYGTRGMLESASNFGEPDWDNVLDWTNDAIAKFKKHLDPRWLFYSMSKAYYMHLIHNRGEIEVEAVHEVLFNVKDDMIEAFAAKRVGIRKYLQYITYCVDYCSDSTGYRDFVKDLIDQFVLFIIRNHKRKIPEISFRNSKTLLELMRGKGIPDDYAFVRLIEIPDASACSNCGRRRRRTGRY